ncbi:MAG: hypothetical protein CMJ64_05680 [Planctomycetaceae bacterium]|nr:hypothetical protein [Planctomycetaceae bacterium]
MKWRLDAGQIEVLDDAMVEVLRKKTPAERVEMISAAHRTARGLVEGGVRDQYPSWDDEQVEAEVRRRLLGGTE